MRSHPGTIKWKYRTGHKVRSSPAIGKDGTIYVGSYDHHLYAIKGNSGGLADTSWPMFHHDVRHSGRKSE
ncbi:MAG: PQQ-binding-like beta-propeller repeat protein [Thermotogae bacterium]|nr:PQQ-binding-like beta-propeller repeat protein [Thermotogota bacterium]